MKINNANHVVILFFTILLAQKTSASKSKREKGQGLPDTRMNKGGIIFLQEDKLELGSVSAKLSQGIAFQNEATSVLKNALKTHTHATGGENFRLVKGRTVVVDDKGGMHARFEQTYDGLEVVGAALVVHTTPDGKVSAINGEFAAAGSIDPTIVYGCSEAFVDIAKYRYYENVAGLAESTWLTECELKVVVDSDGVGHKAWQRMLGYQPAKGPYQKDLVFASVKTGQVVAVHRKVYGALSLETYNCHNLNLGDIDDDYYTGDDPNPYTECTLVSKSSGAIHTEDKAIDDAHNYARVTYKFYFDQYGRDSVDDNGQTIISRVHYAHNLYYAFWDGTQMSYGDGNGVDYGPFSRSPEIVGHELTHGVTDSSSGLIYETQSGSVKEAMSDIFGAAISRKVGQLPAKVWLIGEDVYDGGLRDMANPANFNRPDLFVDQYIGPDDSGGVHKNSGIVSLAFKLLVTGGVHPRYPGTVNVPAINANFDTSIFTAAKIFYMANTACLTPHSGFYAARACTMMHAGPFTDNVNKAWAAVGVITVGTPLTSGVAMNNQALQVGQTKIYTLDVAANKVLKCVTVCDNGNADLYVDSHTATGGYTFCVSGGGTSNESCTLSRVASPRKAVITLRASNTFSGLTIKCTVS